MSRAIHPAVAGAQPYQLADRQEISAAELFQTEEGRSRIAKILSRYPEKRAALLPLLNYVQETRGWVSADDMRAVAETLELSPAYVHSIVTFYTMYHRRPVGRYLIQVCTNIACHLHQAERVLEKFLDETGTRLGETSEDGRFTVTEVECLGACGFATAVQINDEYHENVTPESVAEIVADLR